MKLAVLISGTGSTLAHVIKAAQDEKCDAEVAAVIADRAAPGLSHAEQNQIPVFRLDRKSPEFPADLYQTLENINADLVLLAGWLSVIPSEVTRRWTGKMINVHPSLLPKHGGKGMHGLHVHRAVIAAEEEVSGATIHFVDEGIDTGRTIAQKEVAIQPNETPESLATKVQVTEKSLLIEVLNSWPQKINPPKD